MKYTKKIIGSFLIFSLSFSFLSFPVLVSAAEVTAPEAFCKAPDYTVINKAWAETKQKNSKTYNENFELAQNSYHDYIGCMFDFAEEEILQRTNKAIDWLAPKKACRDPDQTETVINRTSPSQMLGPVLQAHTDYKKYLNQLGQSYSDSGVETDSKGGLLTGTEQYMAKSAFFGNAERKRQMEIDSSLVAIDLMFTTLKELRLAFVMHVHFQCTLKYLEKYRVSLGGLRKLIMPLPGQLRNASVQ